MCFQEMHKLEESLWVKWSANNFSPHSKCFVISLPQFHSGIPIPCTTLTGETKTPLQVILEQEVALH